MWLLALCCQYDALMVEDLGDDDIALGPQLEEKTCDRVRLKTIIRLMIQGATKSTKMKSHA